MKGNVFKINPQTMAADNLGAIKNLPQDYTINGAAVNAEGKIVVSCASKIDHYYAVDASTWEAVVLPKQQQEVFNASDLASSHVLYESAASAKNVSVSGNSVVTVYPNPVVSRTVTVSFDKFAGSNHTIQLVDAAGHNILSKVVNANSGTNTQIILPSSVRSGMYILKVIDNAGKEQYAGKIIVY